MIKVEGHTHLYRDEKSGAIINCDSMGYNQYVNSLRQKELQKNELDKIKDDINEIKSLLKKLTMGNNINI
tara:strand:- start:774 stop:983 length:210 start_codon:yes stop_codon:yes gene_type:complete